MLSYCLKCRKNTESKNKNVARTKNGRIMILLKCAVCYSQKTCKPGFTYSACVSFAKNKERIQERGDSRYMV